ncbi:MAG: histidine kinase dimerization/phospho-acceptor domain-containing protein [Coraliomargarita sp.]
MMNKTHEWFVELFNCLPTPLIITNRNATIQDLNEASCILLNKTREELLGISLRQAFNCVSSAAQSCSIDEKCTSCHCIQLIAKTLETGEIQSSTSPLELESRIPNTVRLESRHFLIRTAQFKLKESDDSNVCFALNEITEQVLLKDALDKASHVKDNFLALINHELRTPLNPIKGYAELLISHVNEEQREQLSIIIQAADKELKLIEELVDYTDLISGKHQTTQKEFHLMELLIAAFDNHSSNRPSRTSPQYIFLNGADGFDPIPQNQYARGDNNLISKAILYILHAIDTENPRGRIEMSVCIQPTSTEHPKKTVLITVRSSSMNMEQLDLCPILDKTNLQKINSLSSRNGFGLGMPIASEIAEILGGSIAKKTARNNGIEVTLKLPLELITS